MGDSKLCLLLLLSTSVLAFAQDGEHPSCLLAQRYKTLHKYEYQYEAELLNAINGVSNLKNGPKASCKVEIEVPQSCSFIVRTTGCSLSEVVDMDAAGNPVFGPSSTSDAFAAEMAKYPLKVVVAGHYDIKLYPEDGETTTILNFKRGIISALAVPLLEEEKNKYMPTIHGTCRTQYSINAREDIATDITLTRDLSRCDEFVPMRDHSSPLAIISGLHYPIAQLVRSSQTCNYKFDNEKKHMTSGSCTENHILLPFSHKGQYGVTNVGKQEISLIDVSAHNDRVFEHSAIVKELHMETVEDKSAVQDKKAALNFLRELAGSEVEGEKRAHLFQSIVSSVRGMKTETLREALPEAIEVSRFLTYQILAQCGTPECSSAIMQTLRTFDTTSPEVDATVFALGLMANPSGLLIHDMLEMAKYKHSKPIMYALSNVVKRFHTSGGKDIPEIQAVAEFMVSELGDCTGDNDQTFMTLRVIGNMAPAVIPGSPALKQAVIQCVKQTAASQEVQQAAIQVFRQIPVSDEDREVFMQVTLEKSNPVQERIAAYLVLMTDPQPTELTQLLNALPTDDNQQVKSFFISHWSNILQSSDQQTQELRQKIQEALQGNEIGAAMDPIKYSRHYKIGSLEGNMIFEDASYLPKEVMLDMTLKAFGFELHMMEFGMEGKGFEPTVDALFGETGFFPDTAMKAMYFVSDSMPDSISEMLSNIMPALDKNRMKRETSKNLMKEIGQNLNKLVTDLKAAGSPEAMVYLRLLGNELGYLKTNDIEEMTHSTAMMIDSMLKMFPADVMKALVTRSDSSIFAHYIFMDNEFFLPTVTGVPLRIALSGTFAPGFTGGLKLSRDMSVIGFMPSAGVEFVTQIGAHIPEYVDSGLEMHTNFFHESGITAKISVARDHLKLAIPAPTKPMKLIKMTNSLVAVTGSELKTITPLVTDKVDVNECTPVFAGMKYCTALQYIDAFSHETAPYFPFTGDSKFAIEFHPTGDITEYTATLAYELIKEGEEGRQKVDTLKLTLRAEGAEPTEATAVMKYNRRKNWISADINIPDYDVEAGFRLGVVDENTKGKGTHSISLDLINKNIPQLSLVGRANLKAMKEGMLEVQLLVPSVKADASVKATIKQEDKLKLELESEIKLMDAISEQKIEIEYDGSKIEVEMKTDMNTKTTSLPNGEFIEEYGNKILDMQVGQTDMKVRHIFRKFVEAANNYMEKYGTQVFPYMQNFRLPNFPEMSMPEKLFLITDSKVVYYFNDDQFRMTFPLPLGGKSTSDLNFPPALTIPGLSLPKYGLEITPLEIPIPEMVFPESFTLSIPYFGKAVLSTKMNSNLYDMEVSLAAGKDAVEAPSYSAKFDVKGTSPVDILSLDIEGSGLIATTDPIKAYVKGSLSHKLIEASISIEEDAVITDKVTLKSTSKMEARSPFGLDFQVEHIGMIGGSTEDMAADNKFKGLFKAGPIYSKTISDQSLTISPFKSEAKFDSSVQFESTFVKARNAITATLAKGEFVFESNTNALEDVFTHLAMVSFRDSKLSMKCDASARALGMKIRNQGEAAVGAGEVFIKVETSGTHSENRVSSLMTASLDVNGLAVECDANMKLFGNEATHKANLKFNHDGLTTNGATTLQSPLTFENTFDGKLDGAQASLSIKNKGKLLENLTFENTNSMSATLSSFEFNSNLNTVASDIASGSYDIGFQLKHHTASANVKNELNFLSATFNNEVKLKAELFKLEIIGDMKLRNTDEDEIKHTYQINYADLTANAKCSTTGKLFGTHMSQNTELEVIGLAVRFNNDARFNSQPMRFDHIIRSSFVPFDFNLEAIFNADGDLTVYGNHGAQLYGKFLLRAQPLAFASSHECRASVKQKLNNGFSLETTYDNKMDTILSPQEQKTSFRTKSKMNTHTFSQDIEVYNTPERIGFEVDSTVLTNIINTVSEENQEFSVSGFLKYDKSTESHIIHFPLIEGLPVFFEGIKGIVVHIAEALQELMNNESVKNTIEAFPQQASDFVAQLNVEDKVFKLKQYFSDLTQTYAFSVEDVEAFLEKLKTGIEKLLANVFAGIGEYTRVISKYIKESDFPENFFQIIQEKVRDLNDIYDFKGAILSMIDTIKEMIKNIDLEKLRGTSIGFLEDLEDKFEIKSGIDEILSFGEEIIEKFDLVELVSFLKNFYVDCYKFVVTEIATKFPADTFNDHIEFIKEKIQNSDIVGEINTFFSQMREWFAQLMVDQKIQEALEKALELLKQFNIEDGVKAIAEIVKNLDIPNKFQDAIIYLKSTEVKDIMNQLNLFIEDFVQKLNSLDYNGFVDHANQIIAKYTAHVNEMIKTLEIPQKLEATREFINSALVSIHLFAEHVRELKVAEIMKRVQDMFDQVVTDPIKMSADNLKKIIDYLISELSTFIDSVYNGCSSAIFDILDLFSLALEIFDRHSGQKFQQIFNGILTELKQTEIETPSFTLPLTNLDVPSVKLNKDLLKEFAIPTQLEIPEFTIMGAYTVKATTIFYDRIRVKIIEFIDFIVNLRNSMLDIDAFFGDMKMNYLPALPEISLPEITLTEITLPIIPQVPVTKLVETLQLPEIKLPTIPTALIVPCFGKLHSEIKLQTPIYVVKTSAEFRNDTETEMTPRFTGFFTSQGTSPSWEIFNYNLNASAQIALPKMKRIQLAETFKFVHDTLKVEQQGSVNLYGKSAQAQTKTTFKVSTTPYTADFTNTAFIGVEGGMTGTIDTSYNHTMNIPITDITSEVSLAQKSLVTLRGLTLTLSLSHTGTGRFNAHDGNHKSKLQMSFSPGTSSLTFTGDTESAELKMKQVASAEIETFKNFKFDIRNAVEAPFIKNSLILATGHGCLTDMKIEMKANHDTELHGADSVSFSNAINFEFSQAKFDFEFQNKGNGKVNIFKVLTAKIDLQNDYLVSFNSEDQKINTLFLARLNQYKMFTNFSLENNKNEAGLFVAMDGEANLDFLKTPISTPRLNVPFTDYFIPAMSDLNLYEQTGLKVILTTTEQTFDVDAKIVYQKSKATPIVMGLIPSIGNLLAELSFKSAIINFAANAGLYPEEDLLFRLGANTDSVFECLKAKVDGTTSLSTKKGIKLANSLSLVNEHISGTHDSSLTLSSENFETVLSVVTAGKIVFPVFKVEVSQNLNADTKSKASALSTAKILADINMQRFKIVGKAEAEHNLKLEGTFSDVFVESTTKTKMDSTLFENYLLLGDMNNEATFYLNKDGIRSTSKIIGEAKMNNGETKIISMDVNNNLAIEASVDRLYVYLKHACNNEAHLIDFTTNGKHLAQATFDYAPFSSLKTDIEIDMAQPNNFGEWKFFEKTVAEMTPSNQKISHKVKFVSPVYNTNMDVEIEGTTPVFKILLKSSATSSFVILEYDLDASSTLNFENDLLNMNNKLVLTHTDLTMDVSHSISQALRRKRQADESVSRHTMNIDITSPSFTDVNLRYAAHRDAISASVSNPSAGFLGLQFNGKVLSQMIARFYGRHPSAPDADVDILVFRTSKDAGQTNLYIVYNMEAPVTMLTELKEKLPSIVSSAKAFADKYQITHILEMLKDHISNYIKEAYEIAFNYDAQMSQLSIFFRNTVGRYQKRVQTFLDAAVKVLRETHFSLPGSDESTTLPESLKKLTSTIASVLDTIIKGIQENSEEYYNYFVEKISTVTVHMPVGDAITGGQVIDQVKAVIARISDEVRDVVKNMESLDTMLEKIGETLKAIFEKTQEFVDTFQSDYLDAVFAKINEIYRAFLVVMNDLVECFPPLNMEKFSGMFESIMERIVQAITQVNDAVNGVLQETSEETKAHMKVADGKLELNFPFHFLP